MDPDSKSELVPVGPEPETPRAPEVTVAPRKGRVAFYRGDQVAGQFEAAQGELWITHTDGSGARRLTSATTCRPAWSPDASRLVFCRPSTTPDRFSLHVIDADGTNDHFLRRGNDASFAPDGRRITFSDAESGDLGDVWTMAADGSDPRRLTRTPDSDYWPSYSPDGQKIAFIRSSGSMAVGTTSLWVMDADGSSPRRLTDVTGTALPIDWSPDGTKIVYTCSGLTPDVCLIGADGRNETRIVAADTTDGAPNWSDDGEWIVFSRDFDDAYAGAPMELWLVRPDGTDLRRVTTAGPGHGDNFPAFEPIR